MIRRLIDMQCASELAGYSVEAYGTSEGVKKAWDERGRVGKHPEHGNFQKTYSGTRQTYYTAGKSAHSGGGHRYTVIVNHPAKPSGATTVTEQDRDSYDIRGNPSKAQQVFKTYRTGGASQENDFNDFMNQRYGIK